jgi:hypothetical protein
MKETQMLLAEIKEANERYEGKAAIQMTTDQRGWGINALTTFRARRLCDSGTALEHSNVRTKHSLQLD